MEIRTTDNNNGHYLSNDQLKYIDDLYAIGNQSIEILCKTNPDLLIFPQILGGNHDGINKSPIFSIEKELLTTHNIMGFVGRNNTRLAISSRFENSHNDYFLHYMLQKVFAINIFDFDQSTAKESIWDFLAYLFPHFLKKAFAQGLYKSYTRINYNDSCVKGVVNVKEHIRLNLPFRGAVAYSVKEYTYDNTVMQLIRHTIEYIKYRSHYNCILKTDKLVCDIVSKITTITQYTYNRNNRQRVIMENLKTLTHPYFTEYRPLQQLCLKILRYEQCTFGNNQDKIYGLLFDGAWLWEEYLNTILKDKFIHPENKTGRFRQRLFEDGQYIYPDFLSKVEPTIVADAKYIPLNKMGSCSENSERAISIYYKTITYMYRFNSNEGLLLFPHPNEMFEQTRKIKDRNGTLRLMGLSIPQNAGSFVDFIQQMHYSENEFCSKV